MKCALGKSCILGLLLAAAALISTSCDSLNSTFSGRSKPENISTHRIKLLVEEDGIYAVTKKELEESGLDIDEFSPADLNLSQGKDVIPFLIQDDQLIFHGLAPQNRYTPQRAYILEVGKEGLPIEKVEVPDISSPNVTEVPQNLHLEENHLYTSEARKTAGDDVWFWTEIKQRGSFDTTVEIPDINEAPAELRFNGWGVTYNPSVDEDHDFEILINDQTVGTVSWDGQEYHTSSTAVAAGILNQGTNKITFDNSKEGAAFLDIMNLNWFDVDYLAPAVAQEDRLSFSNVNGLVEINGFSDQPLIFDISDITQPEILTGWEYDQTQIHLPVQENMVIAASGPDGFKSPSIEPILESDWQNPETQADLIIITSGDLLPFLDPLVKVREEQGLAVAVVPTTDIYDEFGYGEASPESIRNFVAYAVENWQEPQPHYLFLVGDATTDYLGHLSDPPQNLVPSLLVPVQFSGETVSDSRLADVDGDRQPDLAVGRWPVSTPEEVKDLVARTLAYEQGIANNKAIFAADGSEVRFGKIVDRVTKASNFPLEQMQQLEGPQTSDIADLWQDGAWLATYVGHGSIAQWGKEDILSSATVETLNNETPPIVLQFTCLTGLFAHPEKSSLVEAMLTEPEGPVLTIAATSLTLSGHQEPFAIQLLQKIQDPTIIRIGDAFQEAKLSLDIKNADGLREISDTFALFGDPSTPIVRP